MNIRKEVKVESKDVDLEEDFKNVQQTSGFEGFEHFNIKIKDEIKIEDEPIEKIVDEDLKNNYDIKVNKLEEAQTSNAKIKNEMEVDDDTLKVKEEYIMNEEKLGQVSTLEENQTVDSISFYGKPGASIKVEEDLMNNDSNVQKPNIDFDFQSPVNKGCETCLNGTANTNSFQPFISSDPCNKQNYILGVPTSSAVEKPRKLDTKTSCQSGIPHTNSKGQYMGAKVYKFVDCKCRLKCLEKLNLEERKDLCKRFWAIRHWQSQTDFLVNNVKILQIKRRTIDAQNNRSHRVFYLNNKKICRKAFLSTLCITLGRLNDALKRKKKEGLISPDKKVGICNIETPESTQLAIHDFLDEFPKFRSHSCNTQKFYFHPELTIRKLHQLFMEKVNESEENLKISYKMFIKCFHFYNFSIYLPKKETCQFCNQHKIQIKNTSPNNRHDEILKHELHLKNATNAREHFTAMAKKSQKRKDILCFSFEMQKPHPLPFMNTNVSYYLSQLWILNLGIKICHDNQSYMCMWSESDGQRGANEVCSSLFEFLRTQNISNVKRIITFSDGSPDQNQNRTVVAFIIFLCSYFDFEYWEHTYMECGHSDLPNDTDFEKIEKRKKRVPHIFTENEWIKLVENCNASNKFKVIKMKDKFLNFEDLQDELTFCTQNTDEESFYWQQLKWFRIYQNERNIQYKTSLDPKAPQMTMDFRPRNESAFANILPQKCSEVKISCEKYDDIISLLKYIPPVYHDFYINLPHE